MDIDAYDAWFVRSLAHELRGSAAYEARLRAHYEALDEDSFLTDLSAGYFLLDFPGLFGLTVGAFVRYPRVAHSAVAREQAGEVVQGWVDLWRDIIARWPELGRLLMIAYAPGDPEWEPLRISAYTQLATRIPFRAHSSALRKAIGQRAREEGIARAVVVHNAKLSGLALAWGSAAEGPRRVRLGTHWLKDARSGRAVAVPPGAFSWEYFWPWLRQETARLAAAHLLDQPLRAAAPAARGGDVSGVLASLHASPVLDNVGATPREREVAAFFAADPDISSREVAEALGIAPATVRVLWSRLKQRTQATTPPAGS